MSGLRIVVLVNPRSGGNAGTHLLEKFAGILDGGRVYNLSAVGGPRKALEEHGSENGLRIIACGGDGTVGWILSEMDSLEMRADRPPIAIIPLGTGNDLSRSLQWGGRYRDKPLRKVIMDIAKADVIQMDRWTLQVEPLQGATTSNLPLTVLNNYFSVGVDAHIALNFHDARNANPNLFTSRTRNLLYYGLEGGKDLFLQPWRHLMDSVSIVCDGVDLTDRLRAYGCHSVLFLNIGSYAGGTRPWNSKDKAFPPQHVNDGLLEVVAMDNVDLAILHAGGSGTNVCQCKEAVVVNRRPVPMQVDGEPCLMQPSRITIRIDDLVAAPARMLVRNKSAMYAVKDEEIENWAANRIQSGFKLYKQRKSIVQE